MYSLIIVRVGLSLTSEEIAWTSRSSKGRQFVRGHELHNLPGPRNSHTTIVNIKSRDTESIPSDDAMANESLGTLETKLPSADISE